MISKLAQRKAFVVLFALLGGICGLPGSAQPAADPSPLSVTINDAPDPAQPGQQLRWAVEVINHDPSQADALDVVVHDVLPPGATLLSATSPQGSCTVREEALACTLGTLPFGAVASVEIAATLDADIVQSSITNAVAVTSFAPGATQASAAVAYAQTTLVIPAPPQAEAQTPPPADVEQQPPAAEAPVQQEPQPQGPSSETPPQPPVIPKTIAISPACVEPGGSLTIAGEGFDQLGLGEGDVKIGEAPAKILAYSPTGLVVQVPSLSQGTATVNVTGAANAPSVEVKGSCHPILFTDEDADEGYIAGDVLIFFNEEMSPEELEAFRVEYGLETLIHHPLLGYYFAQLGAVAETDDREQARAPVSCLVNKRSSAPSLDVLLLVDRSGTMDAAFLKPLLKELANQMYCLVNRTSRIAVMSYDNQAKLELELAPWREQQQALARWMDAPLQTKGNSDLGEGLRVALEYLQERVRPGASQQIMVLTRGPANPRLQNPQPLIQQALDRGVVIHGVALTNLFFRAETYDALRQIARATQRDLQLLDERDAEQTSSAVACSIVYGLYGEECSQSPVYATPLSDAVTCAIVSGIYGAGVCGREGLEQIPSIRVDRTADVIERLNRDPRVEEAFFNDLQDDAQNDPGLMQQDWFLELGLPQGWDTFFPKQGEGSVIAIIDSGVDLNVAGHRFSEVTLDAIAPDGLNFAPIPPEVADPTANDDLGHGTAVSAITASVVDNAFNGAGVAPKATVVALKVFAVVNGQVKASNDSVAQALMNAFVLGVDVVNMSLGCEGCTQSQEERLRKFYGKILDNLVKERQKIKAKIPIIVAAAGNDGAAFIDAPAFHPAVLAVGSVGADLTQRSVFSNYGPELDFVALGENTMTTLVGGAFSNPGSGTSFAAPQVSGLVALILAQKPGLNQQAVVDEIKRCFVADVAPPGFDEETGWGRVHIPEPGQADAACLPVD